jgi:hypothetical protein
MSTGIQVSGMDTIFSTRFVNIREYQMLLVPMGTDS